MIPKPVSKGMGAPHFGFCQGNLLKDGVRSGHRDVRFVYDRSNTNLGVAELHLNPVNPILPSCGPFKGHNQERHRDSRRVKTRYQRSTFWHGIGGLLHHPKNKHARVGWVGSACLADYRANWHEKVIPMGSLKARNFR